MKFQVFIMTLVSLSSSGCSLRTSDICQVETKCENNICETALCNHVDYKFKCGVNMCAKTKHACEMYTNLYIIARMNSFRSNDKQQRRYQSFKKYVRDCTHHRNMVSLEVCARGVECYVKKKFTSKTRISQIVNKIDCPCPEEYSYECGKYCSIGKNECDQLIKMVNNSTYWTTEEAVRGKIEKCGNDGLVLKENLNDFRIRY